MVKQKKSDQGKNFAKNSVVFAIIILFFVIIGFIYHYLVPSKIENSGVPSQPVTTLVPSNGSAPGNTTNQ